MILLIDENCAQRMLSRRELEIRSRLARIENSQPGSSLFGPEFEMAKVKQESGEFERRGSIAIIKISGALDYRYDFWAWLFDCSCYMGITNAVRQALNDTSIKKIVLSIDCIGGSFFGCQECSDAIYAAREAKEVVAVIDPEAASAGYWLASQASRIVAVESGWCGSIGSQIALTSYYRMYKEMGIDSMLVRADISPNKNLGYRLDELSDKAIEDRQRMANYAGDLFLKHVERGRSKSRKEILDKFGQGLMFFTPEAIERGMVDSVGYLADEVNDTKPAEATVPKSRIRSKLSAIPFSARFDKCLD